MRITFVTRKFGNVERNSHCDVLHITPIRVARLFLDCNGDFAIKAYGGNRCLCKVYAGGAQSNNSVGAQRNSVTVVDFHSDVVISDC